MRQLPKFVFLIFLILFLGQPSSVHADAELMYRLGGGVPIGSGPTNRAQTVTLGAGVSWNADLTCGNFDINASIQNQLNGVTGAFQNMMSNIINAATGVVASLPALVIQRLNPALYDLLQNGMLQASEEFHLAEVSCERIVEQMGNTVEQEGWAGLAEAQWWRTEANAGTDILEAKDNAETVGLDNGVTWRGGAQAGGSGQPAIVLHEDTSVAGMNLILGRAADDVGAVPANVCAGARICETWTSPPLMAAWLVDVIGETQIQTCQGCAKMTTRAGMGLQRKYEQERQVILNALTPVVTAGNNPNQDTLDAFAGGEGFTLTREVIEAIRQEDRPGPIIERLSAELAMSRTMERAMMVRRALLAGMKEPNIANNEIAQAELVQSVEELNDEIENMVFELEVNRLLASNTTVQLLSRARVRQQSPIVERLPSNTIREGATN